MKTSKQADNNATFSMGLYKVISLIVAITFIGIIAMQQKLIMPSMSNKLIPEMERLNRNILLIRAQWGVSGNPKRMPLQWEHSSSENPVDFQWYGGDNAQNTFVSINSMGWPYPDSFDAKGCKDLWESILGTNAKTDYMIIEYDTNLRACTYTIENKQISYHLAGDVTYRNDISPAKNNK